MPYLDKPPLLYALLAGVVFRRGAERSVRPRRLGGAALVAIAATAWLGARLLGGRAGLMAGLALSTSLGFFVYGRYVRPETLLLAMLAVGFALTLTALVEARRARVIAGLAVFGLAALAKDPLAALGPPLAIGLALALGGRARPLDRWLPWPGVVLGLVLAFGWWALAEYATPGLRLVHGRGQSPAERGARPPLPRRGRSPRRRRVPGRCSYSASFRGSCPRSPASCGSCDAAPGGRPRSCRGWRSRCGRSACSASPRCSPFRLPHYGLPAYPAHRAARRARLGVRSPSRTLAAVHALMFGALAVAAALAWTTDGSAFMTGVLGATDVATRKMSAARRPAAGATVVGLPPARRAPPR